jgi:hypothetical protein
MSLSIFRLVHKRPNRGVLYRSLKSAKNKGVQVGEEKEFLPLVQFQNQLEIEKTIGPCDLMYFKSPHHKSTP